MGQGPLQGLKIVEMAGLAPGPFAAMMLADMGADVLRITRPVPEKRPLAQRYYFTDRNRRSIAVDLKSAEGVALVKRLVGEADALIEGFRPGVMERLGLGPEVCLALSPRLVYGRMTGWGQDGPLAQRPGHDINYIALTGALEAIGEEGRAPVAPLNLVGDFGGGGMYLAFGIACGIIEAARSGRGQVIDAAMVDGAALLNTFMHGLVQVGAWSETRGTNMLDTGAPFYDAYECSDGEYVSIGSIEPQFYAELLRLSGLGEEPDLPAQMDRSQWPALKERVARLFKQKTRDEWCALMEHTDVCFAPVLSVTEAYRHPHNVARSTFVEVEGFTQPGPAPRFSRTPGAIERPPARPGQHTDEALATWGFDGAEIEKLRAAGAIA
jgi:alpha-methylacyl-CoA racemase